MVHYFANPDLLVISDWHIFLVIVVALLLFGGKKIPELMRGLGSGIREFNDAKNNVKREIEEGIKKESISPAPPSNTASNTTNPVNPIPPANP